jgi:hypothetical protein
MSDKIEQDYILDLYDKVPKFVRAVNLAKKQEAPLCVTYRTVVNEPIISKLGFRYAAEKGVLIVLMPACPIHREGGGCIHE